MATRKLYEELRKKVPGLARVRQMFFGNNYAPGTVLEVPRLGLSRDILLEVEPVAIVPSWA